MQKGGESKSWKCWPRIQDDGSRKNKGLHTYFQKNGESASMKVLNL